MSPIALSSTNESTLSQLKSAIIGSTSSTQARQWPETFHPLDQLTPDEILLTSNVVRHHVASQTSIKAFKFISTSLCEPAKLDVLKFLGIPTKPDEEVKADRSVLIERKVDVTIIDEVTGTAYDLVVLLSTETTGSVISTIQLPEGTQPSLTVDELCIAEEVCRKSEVVKRLAAEVGVKTEQLYCDGWSIGIDKRFPQSQRLQQCIMYARLSEHDNLYAHPMDFYPIIDCNTHEILTVDFAPTRNASNELSTGTTIPPDVAALEQADCQTLSGRERIPPPMKKYDFLADLIKEENPEFKIRDDLKPLNISQPEGVSFRMNGNSIEWQKWNVHIAFHHREGLVLNTVTYNDNGKVRPIIYSMGLAEMVVPYGAPEHPHPRKFAFDVGEYGLGILANELSLGCDCKGVIHYMPGAFVTHSGKAEVIQRAICIHEEDAGLLWKHTDYRKGGRGQSVRSRKLVISSIFTIANYEYALYWNFYQDGSIECEVRLTGILNLYVLAEGEGTGGHGTEVAPRINAHLHQHLFSLRVNPMIDGVENTVVEQDVVPMDEPTGSKENFLGNGFIAKKTYLGTTAEGVRNYDNEAGRQWSFINENKKHYASKQPVGYKVMCKDMPPLLPKPDSWVAKRAPFATKSLWVAPYAADQRYPSGKHVPQTRETPADSIVSWTSGNKNIRNTDLAAWITFGVTHVPRPEDFPVMPVEHCRLMMKPVGFFEQNPALDVPGTTDKFSEEAFGHKVGATNGDSCCA